jgi:hypothetical protein
VESIEVLARILDLGATGILAAILWTLWKEFREQNRFIREMLLEGEAERRALAERLGMTTLDLKAEAQIVRQRWAYERANRGNPSEN